MSYEPALHGKANAALMALFADKPDMTKSMISLASGGTSRQKRLKIERGAGMLAKRLGALLSTLQN